jgi:signal transduction histidine kinase
MAYDEEMDAPKALPSGEEIFRRIADHSHLGIWILTPEGMVTYINDAAKKIWAGSAYVGPADYQEYKAWDLETGKEFTSKDWGAWKVMMNDETVIDQVVKIQRFDGRMGVILNSAIPLKDESGKLTAILVMNHDITELKESESKREEIVKLVSHDLKNPLHAILMSAEILQTKLDQLVSTGNTQKLHHFIEMIVSSAKVSMGLVKDILEVAKFEQSPFQVKAENFSAGSLLTSIRPIYDPLAEYKNITLKWEIQPFDEIYGDRERILQVMSNIIGNAIKFTLEGGVISVTSTDSENGTTFEICDTGPGIPAEHLQKIFHKNYQVQGRPMSMGLGLYIAQMIIAAHGGKIWVKSHLGKGSHFYFTIPKSSGS